MWLSSGFASGNAAQRSSGKQNDAGNRSRTTTLWETQSPSAEDLSTTARLMHAAKIVGVPVERETGRSAKDGSVRERLHHVREDEQDPVEVLRGFNSRAVDASVGQNASRTSISRAAMSGRRGL